MEHTRTDSAPRSVTLTAYDFAMEEVAAASSRLAHALSARPQKREPMPLRSSRSVPTLVRSTKSSSPVSAGTARRRAARLTSQGAGAPRVEPEKVRSAGSQIPTESSLVAPGTSV